ncbi:MAG: AIR carboxylase family protein [Candidatus Bathyarchaeota archaeon]|nr:AIR carboxylase family protein [Candidatus Bathyarchaeota archaeon]
MQKLIVLMGSRKDILFARRIGVFLEKEEFLVEYEYNVSSAHKTPKTLIKKLENYEKSGDDIVYITVAGLSDALSGTVAGYSKYPVIACPPDSKKYRWTKVFSSMITPQGVPVLFISEPENAALAAVKILAFSNHSLYEKIAMYQQKRKEEVIKADKEIKGKKIAERDVK